MRAGRITAGGSMVLFSAVFVLASVIAVSGAPDTAASSFPLPAAAAATENQARVTTTQIGSNMAVEKSVIGLHVPKDNSLPWAFVEGAVSNPVPDYPVIIQIYDDDGGGSVAGNSVGAVHFAQAEVGPDGIYEYRFRVLDSHRGSIFEGDYTIKIFKVVYLDDAGSGVSTA